MPSTQDFLEVEEIRQGVLVLKDRTIRGVLLVSSQNFALKSREEQEATIAQFQNFLNSLDFSLQVVIQSRKLNITGYIDELRALEGQQSSSQLKSLLADYRNFIEQLIAGSQVMAKNFFVVVPFSLIETLPLDERKRTKRVKLAGSLSDEELQQMKNQLWQRLEFVASGLKRIGLKVAPLNNEELIELLWSWHHPKEAEIGYFPEIPPEIFR